jgi:L-serine dehydratase
MKATVSSGLLKDGIIPGGLNIKRRAKMLLKKGNSKSFGHEKEIYLLSAYAYAASEENAIGEQMVTAPTCGASGVLPAVLIFKQQELGFDDEEVVSALAVAGVIGNLVKHNASISGAECGCQAEIGTACTMAAAALAYLKGLSIKQIECAAEIALEHHLGLTCDPIKGLVQIPCIERNAVAAMRAVDAVSLAEMLYENRKISLDLVIKTMYETGRDLSFRYRETSEGGLASLYVAECD